MLGSESWGYFFNPPVWESIILVRESMGKKIKKKGRSAHKERRGSSARTGNTSEHSNWTAETTAVESSVVKEEKSCPHIDQYVDSDKIAWKVGGNLKCEDCMDNGGPDRRPVKGKVKQSRRREVRSENTNSKAKSIWLCLNCGHLSCGGISSDRVPKSHALQHARRTHHPCAIRIDNSLLCWCFSCNSVILVQSSEGSGESGDGLCKVKDLIKELFQKNSPTDVEDVWFGSELENKNVEKEKFSAPSRRGYVVQGLVNLGNTCFFNSVMQNILAMNTLRIHFSNLSSSLGPLTRALKQLFVETGPDVDPRNSLNPKSFFGCICAKAPQFRGYQQQDSHELLRYLLDGLCTEELNARKLVSSDDEDATSSTSPTFVDLVFGGQISSTVRGMECGHTSIVYEPFLDLSLPLPAKKPVSRKAQVSQPKRGKMPYKGGNKGGKAQERKKKNVVAPASYQSKSEPLKLPLESTDSSLTFDSGQTHAEEVANLGDSVADSWLDYIGEDTSPENVSSISQGCCSLVDQATEEGETSRCENSSESPTNNFSVNETLRLDVDSTAEKPVESEDLPKHVQDSEILLLPYKENDLTTLAVTRGEEELNQNLVNGTEAAEDFDGFGDLFNEPEADSSSKAEARSNDEMDIALFTGNSGESTPDEVDNTSSEVTVDSCLAFFTKPELLLDEHAWYCESCSNVMKGQTKGSGDTEEQTGGKDNPSRSFSAQVNVVEVRNQDMSSSSNDNHCADSNESDGSDNRNLASNTEKLEPINMIDAELPLSHSCESGSFSNEFGKERNEKRLELLRSLSNQSRNHPQDAQCDGGILGSNHSCEQHAGSRNSVEFEGTEPENIGGNGSSASVVQTCHEDSECNGDRVEDHCGSLKVKRDATKRILINKSPHILTIHLKRFGQDARGRLNKISGHVSFREILDLRPYMQPRCGEEEKCQYHLLGVVEHLGTMREGHYVAYVRGENNKALSEEPCSSMWFYASDSAVREVSLAEVLQSEAYLLFYEKV